MEGPSGSSFVAPPPSPVGVTAVLPGLETIPGAPVPPLDAPDPGDLDDAARISALAAHIADPAAERSLDGAVSALEEIRRLESWVAWSKHRLASAAVRAAETEQERWLTASSIDTLDDDASRPGLTRGERLAVGERSGIAEVACALHVSEGTVHALVNRAERLATRLTRTAAAMRAGRITATAGTLIADETNEYAEALTSAVDEATVDRLTAAIASTETGLLAAAERGRTKAELEARARRIRERCHPSSFAERERAARSERFVRISPDRDGMARLSALLPAAIAWRIDGRLSTMARTLAAAPATVAANDGGQVDDATPLRTITQLRADVLADLLTGLPTSAANGVTASGGRAGDGPRRAGAAGDPVPQVLLTVPAETMLGGDDPGQLGTFGPIAAADARDLAALAASFMIGITTNGPGIVTDGTSPGETGAVTLTPVLVTNGAQYRIPAALRRALAVRDGTCRFPGCRRSAARCDIDHVLAWADGGSTEPGNLAHTCRKHHVLKHHSEWSVSAGPPGSLPGNSARSDRSRLSWTSPSGRRYTTEPDDPPPF